MTATGITITNATDTAYNLGMAETGSGTDGWYGEDCTGSNICHPATATGTVLTSVHPDVGGGGIPDIDDTHTLFYGGLDANTTYAVVDSTGACWTWGNDVSYYSSCTAM